MQNQTFQIRNVLTWVTSKNDRFFYTNFFPNKTKMSENSQDIDLPTGKHSEFKILKNVSKSACTISQLTKTLFSWINDFYRLPISIINHPMFIHFRHFSAGKIFAIFVLPKFSDIFTHKLWLLGWGSTTSFFLFYTILYGNGLTKSQPLLLIDS